MKVAVYSIAKNEAAHVNRWAASAIEADTIVLLDTGSTDETVELARAAGVDVHVRTFTPWRFDDARNASLQLVPEDVDYCIALDLDEILIPGWREALHVAHENGWTRPRYTYTWSWNPDGTPGLVYGGDKIHARHGYVWRHPVHEVITPLGVETPGWVELQIQHHPDHGKSRAQYLPLLELAVTEDPDDPRNAFYYARELYFVGDPKAAHEFHRYLQLPGATWTPERSRAMRYLAELTTTPEAWLMRACAEAPERREPWTDLARHYYRQEDWPSCYAATRRALSIHARPLEYLCEAQAWGPEPYDLAALAAYNLGLYAEACSWGETAAEMDPADERLARNVEQYTHALRG